VDIVDQMTRKYSTKAPSRRWPMHIFYNILNIAGINSRVLYQEASNRHISRYNFLEDLINQIARETKTADIGEQVKSPNEKKNAALNVKKWM